MTRKSSLTRRSPGASGAIALLALLLVGDSLLPAQSLAQTSDSLSGSFAVALSRDDIPTDLAGGYGFVGRWIISFNDDGSYVSERQDVGIVVTGTFTTSGSQVTITDESGLVSCSNASATTISPGDISTGTYEFAQIGQNLTLTPVDDSCRGRVVLLSSRALTVYVPCTTVALEQSDVVTDGTPEAVEETGESDDPLSSILTQDDPNSEEATAQDDGSITEQIDTLLRQMSACWSTGDPSLWLPLLSTEFRASLIGNSPDFESTISAAMSTPIVWERAGELDVESSTRVTAIVRATVGLEQDFQRFIFVFEDGEWRWDG